MSQTYFTILTNLGAAKLAEATASGSQLKLTHLSVGDGNGNVPSPLPTQTQLIHEVRRSTINTVYTDENNENHIIIEQVIPPEEGGFYIRELGVFDDKGNLIAVGNCPPSYKPKLSEGSGRTQIINMVIMVDNTGTVELKIDASSVVATRKYVDDLIKTKMKNHEESINHPTATTNKKGIVQLDSSTTSEVEDKAATPKAVKAVYDLANKALPKLGGEVNQLTVSGKLEAKGNIEVYGNTPYIDFHFANSDLDYTSRIIEPISGRLNISAPKGLSLNSSDLLSTETGFKKLTFVSGGSVSYIKLAEGVAAGINRGNITLLVGGAGNIGSTQGSTTLLEFSTRLGGGLRVTHLTETNKGQPEYGWLITDDGMYELWAKLPTYQNNFSVTELSANSPTTSVVAMVSSITAVTSEPANIKYIKPEITLTTANISNYIPIGIPQPWPTSTPPTGWLKCNGAIFDKTLYPKLAIAYPTGKLPDLRGEFIRGYDDGRGIDSDRNILSCQSQQVAAHKHVTGWGENISSASSSNIERSAPFGSTSEKGNWCGASGGDYDNPLFYTNDGTNGSITTTAGKTTWSDLNVEGLIGTENRPRNIAFLYIVKAE